MNAPYALRPKRTKSLKAKADSGIFGKYKPDPHQVISLGHARTNNRVLDFSDAGTGKTPVALWAYADDHVKGDAGCMLVIATRTLLKNVWEASVQKFTPYLTCSVAEAKNRAQAFEADVNIYITNTDAAVWLAKQNKKFFARFTHLTIDESSAYKHHSSQRSRAINKIKKHFNKRRLMTGTPRSRSITDVWNQANIADDGQRLGTSFYAFRNTVCIPEQKGRNANAIEWMDKDGAEEAVFGLLSDITIRHEFDKVVKIPERRVHTVPFTLSAKHMKAYDQMAKQQFLIVQEMKNKGTVTAINAAVVRQKLLQIASGAVYGDRYEEGDKPVHIINDDRYEMIMDLAEEAPHSLLLFLWGHQRDALVAEAVKRNLRYAVADGTTSDRIKDQLERDYQTGLYDVVIAHPKTVAHGLTLTRGRRTIWASPTDDAEWFEQANRRQARRGQTQETEVITILARGTADEGVYENTARKSRGQKTFLDLFVASTAD